MSTSPVRCIAAGPLPRVSSVIAIAVEPNAMVRFVTFSLRICLCDQDAYPVVNSTESSARPEGLLTADVADGGVALLPGGY